MSASSIFIDRLKAGSTQKFDELFDPSFLGENEPELKFHEKVHVKAEAYLTDDHLIIHLDAKTKIKMPCAICNQMSEWTLEVKNAYHAEPLEEIKGAEFDIREPLREALLLEMPRTIECNGGKCPERKSMSGYMRMEAPSNFPFADIDKNENRRS